MASRASSLSSVTLAKVVLNVYDLNPDANDVLYGFGLGLYHSGVQVGGNEWTFASGSGIFSHDPRQAGGARFREAIEMGSFSGTQRDLDRILDELRDSFKGTNYHILTMNCNSFSEALVTRMLNKSIPGFVNRMAMIGSYFSCLLPASISNDAPVNQPQIAATKANPFSGEGRRLLVTDSTKSAAEKENDSERKEKIRAATLARANQHQS